MKGRGNELERRERQTKAQSQYPGSVTNETSNKPSLATRSHTKRRQTYTIYICTLTVFFSSRCPFHINRKMPTLMILAEINLFSHGNIREGKRKGRGYWWEERKRSVLEFAACSVHIDHTASRKL